MRVRELGEGAERRGARRSRPARNCPGGRGGSPRRRPRRGRARSRRGACGWWCRPRRAARRSGRRRRGRGSRRRSRSSSPRETSTFLPIGERARAPAASAAALLLTTSAASAPVSCASARSAKAPRGAAPPGGEIDLDRGVAARGARRARRRRARESGARPRLVWRTTPVALITGRARGREGRAARGGHLGGHVVERGAGRAVRIARRAASIARRVSASPPSAPRRFRAVRERWMRDDAVDPGQVGEEAAARGARGSTSPRGFTCAGARVIG